MLMKHTALALLGLACALALAACGPQSPQPTATPCPSPQPCPPCPTPAAEAPFQELWAASGHADATAAAFTHWNEETPPEIPPVCAKCHSTPGFQDFLGADGSAAGVVDKAAPVGTVITCVACHNEATQALTSTVFPSGAVVSGLGAEARCMQCHQGNASGSRVDESITAAGLSDPDTVSDKLGFTNIHYMAAAATLYGRLAGGGYQYPGKAYDARFAHVEGIDTCLDCHDSHSLEVRVERCAECHQGVSKVEDLRNVRMVSSGVDYDGDGDTQEGIFFEIEGLRNLLYQAIQAYAKEVPKTPIVYDPAVYPYFFIDANGNGTADPEEANPANKYNAWTGRLAKAAYNYQFSVKDPGAYAHGGKYVIELLYDSIEDLNTRLSQPIDLSKAHRIDAGHFASSEEAFRHWDAEGEVPGACAKCHTAEGLPVFIKNGTNIAVEPSSNFFCSTCHNNFATFSRFEVQQVTFPSGAKIDSGNLDTNLCMNCHQGRESTVSVNRLIAGLEDDTVSDKLRFLNVHYFAAGATLFGGDAQGAYQYEGKSYQGRFPHVEGFNNCTQCHSAHQLAVNIQACGGCHPVVKSEEDLKAIRMSPTDYDGDGDTAEGLAGEIATMHETLYAALQAYARDVVGEPIAYHPAAYPYFFIDQNGNGQVDPEEANPGNRYVKWTPRLLRAAYNYQYVAKDPGAFAHNGKYILQVLYDTLQDLSKKVPVNVGQMVRP